MTRNDVNGRTMPLAALLAFLSLVITNEADGRVDTLTAYDTVRAHGSGAAE